MRSREAIKRPQRTDGIEYAVFYDCLLIFIKKIKKI